jgi:hypothetical protein
MINARIIYLSVLGRESRQKNGTSLMKGNMQLQPHLDPYVKARTFIDNFAPAEMEMHARANLSWLTTRYCRDGVGVKEAHQLHPEEGRKLLPALQSWRRRPPCLDLSEGLPQVDLVCDALPRLHKQSLQTVNEPLSDLGEKQWGPLFATKRC